ncbi:MAG: FKBP-type peptidyl-prolyl cis-trans isomerase [Chitinophagaceae bacterium]|nr:FKBP-type peptidyl-prolyl cis-trans isomerase [Chitinophagaceae bacterium]
MMKKLVFILLVPFMLSPGSGCIKDKGCQAKTVASEEGAILNFAATNGITATKHASGMYYQIINQGSGPTPTPTSTLSVKYTGKFTNGTIFEQVITTPVSFTLSGVIPGWQLGLPLIQKGGIIKLIIPSSLGYGCSDYGSIPGSSVLYFEIELVDVL